MAQREIMTMVEFMERFNTEEKCREYLYKMRWLERYVCPHCGAKAEPFRIRSRSESGAGTGCSAGTA